MIANTIPTLLGLALPIGVALSATAPQGHTADPCETQANEALISCRRESISDYWLARAKCTNLPTLAERIECYSEAEDESHDAWEECSDIKEARVELCQELGGGFYAPIIDPNDFVVGIDNPYLPYVAGSAWQYKLETKEETEIIDIVVLSGTVEILGVECTPVQDIVSIDGEVQEDTIDWFAQDVFGNVWYFGEISFNYEDGEISDLDGSWKAGVDGALPGIVMHANPVVGQVYRQEMLLREAEDVGVMLSLSEPVTVPFGSFTNCRQSEDYSPLDPGETEYKFYAAGVGLVLEVEPESGDRLELIQMTTN